MCVCVGGVSVCVRGWVAKERILSSTSFGRVRLSERSSLVCLFWREDHTKSCARMNLREGPRLEIGVARTKDVGQFISRLGVEEIQEKRVSNSQKASWGQ